MRFLLDVCAASRSMHTLLTELGHDVLLAGERDTHATDEAVLALAHREGRVLITEDKDFGELVFVRRLDHPCIVRFVEMRVAEKAAAMRELIEQYSDAMHARALFVVTRKRVRIRLSRRIERGDD